MTMGLPPRAATELKNQQVSKRTESRSKQAREVHTLLIGVERLLEEVVAGQDHDDGKVLVRQNVKTLCYYHGYSVSC